MDRIITDGVNMAHGLFVVLSVLCTIYLIVILLRVMLSWAGGSVFGNPYRYLCRISDPYLDFFKRFRFFRFNTIDISPLFAAALLSTFSTMFWNLSVTRHWTAGLAISMALLFFWSVISALISFYVFILIIRFIGYRANSNIYSPFWRVVDYLARPVHYRISRIFFRSSSTHYQAGMIISILCLIALYVLVNAGYIIIINALRV